MMQGAKELIIDEANQLNESKAEVKHLKETLETQVYTYICTCYLA